MKLGNTSGQFAVFALTLAVISCGRLQAGLVADLAGDWISPAALPANWQYFQSTAASGGTETALAANQAVGNVSATGFGGGEGTYNTAIVLGEDNGSSGQYEIFNTGFEGGSGPGHHAVVGTDLLVHPGNTAGRAFVIMRYTVTAADLDNHALGALTLAGSFRNLTTASGVDSVTGLVYHNGTQLFAANGSSAGGSDGNTSQLSQVDGTFHVQATGVAVGDRIDFVVGRNGSYSSDETAVRGTVALTGAVIANAAADWVASDGSTAGSVVGGTGSGWSYLRSDAATGGNEHALVQSVNTGDTGGPGFAGTAGTGRRLPAILGDNANGGDFELFSSGDANAAVVGSDLLFHPGHATNLVPDGDVEFVIARYTLAAGDLTLGNHVNIEGSFRNLIEGGGDAVSAFIYQNDTLLFSVDGSDIGGSDGNTKILSQVDGTFAIFEQLVAVGDTISFVVGQNANINGDETVLRATITNIAVPTPAALPAGLVLLGAFAMRRRTR